MGLASSDALRLLMMRVTEAHRLPFEMKVPNAVSRQAIADLEAGKGERFVSDDALVADQNADN